MRRLDIGICAYNDAEKLARAVAAIKQYSVTDWRLLIVDNSPADSPTRPLIELLCATDIRINALFMPENVGYAGAVNEILAWGESDFVGYLDHDAYVQTPGWDEQFCSLLEAHGELGWVFPGPGHYGFDNGKYRECLWSAGYCWIMRAAAAKRIGERRPASDGHPGFDRTLGHHDEVDYMIRMRLDGWRIACCPDVNVIHDETATQADSADHKPGGRIHDGVVRWMNKWNRYFSGDDLEYSMTAYDARALRYTDWNVDALYLERMTLHYFPDWNSSPETVHVPGAGEMDVVKVLKPKGPYKGRAI